MFKDVFEENSNNFNVKDEYKHLSVEELKKIQESHALPFRVCALNVEGDLNVGMMARSAALLGVEKFYVFGRRKIDRRSLVGAQNYLPIERVEGLDADGNVDHDKFVEFCEKENLYPVLLEHGGNFIDSIRWTKLAPAGKTLCLVFGNESNGFPESFRKKYFTVSIYQFGVLRSFNVAAAAGIAMWQCSNQFHDLEAGM
jgi:tRNA G18 (ribose-2'-O)-methylase SpoU